MENTADRGPALEKIYRETGPDLLAFFQRRHGSLQAAEDLLQETFAAVLKNPDRLWQADSAQAYLFGVARNLSAEMFRRSRPGEDLPSESHAAQECLVDPRLELMREGIERLNPLSRQVLELRMQRELSYQEMASVLGVPIGTIRSRLHHAVQQLRKHMETRDHG